MPKNSVHRYVFNQLIHFPEESCTVTLKNTIFKPVATFILNTVKVKFSNEKGESIQLKANTEISPVKASLQSLKSMKHPFGLYAELCQ